MVAADKNHVYLTDYNDGPRRANDWMVELVSNAQELKFPKVHKFFIVLNAHTGAVLANITLCENQPIHTSMIIAGSNNDVFVGIFNGVVRIFTNTSSAAQVPELM